MHIETAIDMFNPYQACESLHTDEADLLHLVNTGRLTAYNLGGNIRFRVSDVRMLANDLVAA